jgi:high-affinity iron transporter
LLASWLPTHMLGFGVPGWMSLWPAVFPTVETVAAQAVAAALVVGSALVAEYMRVTRPRRRGRQPARRPEEPQPLFPQLEL